MSVNSSHARRFALGIDAVVDHQRVLPRRNAQYLLELPGKGGKAGIAKLVGDLGNIDASGAQMAALSICIAGGSIVVSHVNDAGFWLFGKFTGATEAQTLKTWTLMETILGTTGAIVGMIAFTLLS